jgi:hypothetical protein
VAKSSGESLPYGLDSCPARTPGARPPIRLDENTNSRLRPAVSMYDLPVGWMACGRGRWSHHFIVSCTDGCIDEMGVVARDAPSDRQARQDSDPQSAAGCRSEALQMPSQGCVLGFSVHGVSVCLCCLQNPWTLSLYAIPAMHAMC